MGVAKCSVTGCESVKGSEKDEGVTFHRFPQTNASSAEKWIKACRMPNNFKPTKHHFICSRHFRRENFTTLQSGKIILKSFTTPSIFPWNKLSPSASKTSVNGSDEETNTTKNTEQKESEVKEEPVSEKTVENEAEQLEVTIPIKREEEVPAETPETSKKKSSSSSKKKSKKATPVPVKPKKSSKRLSAKLSQSDGPVKKVKTESPPVVEKLKSAEKELPPPAESTPKKKNAVINFIPGTSIEAQNFDGKWLPVKIIEVDTEEREVLVRLCDKNNKSKIGSSDEWISMDSPRLRPTQPAVTFEVEEKVLARWNDCRKFPATIKRVLENDSYDVLFDDGYPKIVRGVHIQKLSGKNAPKTLPSDLQSVPTVINPLLLNPPSLIPDYIKEMKDLPAAPTEGEWCCVWVDDIPVGEESTVDGTHGKFPSIVIPDWRVKEGWQKHIYLRQNGKWDVLFISPTNRRLRFKTEMKKYLTEIGEIYDPEVWDFSLHKKRSKMLNLCITTDKLKQQVLQTSTFEVKSEPSVDGTPVFNNPYATLGALPYVQPNLVQAPPTQTEINIGSLKVKVVNNIYLCPEEGCDKQFRKENHLQLHIKHYHENLSKMMGECPNMEDLAYLRTTADEAEITLVKSARKSQGTTRTRIKTEPNDSYKDMSIDSPIEIKFNQQRSPILEEALKAPIKLEKDFDIKTESTDSLTLPFDPETLIPPHAVSRPQQNRSHNKRRMRMRFNPKSKSKSSSKKRSYEFYQKEEVGSTVEGVIPYHEGPYFKNQQPSSYVDENGELIKIVRMKKEEIINCACGFGEEDGLMIQCELCLCWQHGICYLIEKSNQVPEKHICSTCKNPYRQRMSLKHIHDQDWLYDGKLPISDYHISNPKQAARFDMLKKSHTLIGNLIEMKKFMGSLEYKINIAENTEHPKLYLWSKKWEESPPRDMDSKEDVKRDINFDDDIKMQPVAPEPAEAAIEPAKCQQTLLDHIQFQQNAVKSRLDNIEADIEALENESIKLDGKKTIDDFTLKQTIYMLINDLKQMNNFSDIQRNPLPEDL